MQLSVAAMKAEVTIVRPGIDEGNPIRIILRVARGKTITVEMTPYEFALALTGGSERQATMRLRNIELKLAGGSDDK